MGLLDRLYSFSKVEKETWSQQARKAMLQIQGNAESGFANYNKAESAFYGHEYDINQQIFDGEKTQGELGAPIHYTPAYTSLSYRSWQAYTESDLAQIVVKNTVNWVIGSGLKLQSEPILDIIEAEGFNFDKKQFQKNTEVRFRLYAKTNDSVHNGMMNFNAAQRTAYLNAIVGGDVLCLLRVSDQNLPTIQFIDGVFIQDPGMDEIEKARLIKNQIIHGVEVDGDRRHVAFHVIQEDGTHKRILARGEKSKRETAFLYYGTEYRIDSVRGLPLMSAVLEKMKKLDRYNEAVVAKEEEAAKMAWWFEHGRDSTGVNPDIAKVTNLLNDPSSTPTDTDVVVDMSAQTKIIKRTYEKEALNLPVDAKLKRFEGGTSADQEAFVTGNFIYICAALEIPYEVALMKYVNSFSSSRMASQSFLFILHIKRSKFNDCFASKYFNLFLDLQILTGKIKAEGYFSAVNKKDVILLQAYRNSRFTGPGVPQADPAKEAKAEITKIEANLTTHEQAMERLNTGDDFDTIADKLADERKKIIDVMPVVKTEPIPGK